MFKTFNRSSQSWGSTISAISDYEFIPILGSRDALKRLHEIIEETEE